MKSENWIFLDSGDVGAIGNALAVSQRLQEDTGLPSRILFIGDYYWQERLLLRDLENLQKGIFFTRLPKSTGRLKASDLDQWLLRASHFDVSMQSWLFTLFGSIGTRLRPSLIRPIAIKLQRRLCRRLLASLCLYVEDQYANPVEVVIPNGRFPQEHVLRAFFLERGVRLSFYEKSQYVEQAVFFQKYSVHDASGWARASKTQKIDELAKTQAVEWFKARKRPGSRSNPFSSRFSQSVEGSGFDVALFSSSFEEFMSLVPRRLGDWSSQFEAFGTFLERLKLASETPPRIALRLHPHLASKPMTQQIFEYLEAYRLCKRFPGLEVFSPLDRIDTYSLLSSSDLTVVMQSTVGLESAFEGRHVVVLYEADYSHTVAVDNLFSKERVEEWVYAPKSHSSESAVMHIAGLVSRDRGLRQVQIDEVGICTTYKPRDISEEVMRLTLFACMQLPRILAELTAPIMAGFASVAFSACKLNQIRKS